jgi:hypothetical protein
MSEHAAAAAAANAFAANSAAALSTAQAQLAAAQARVSELSDKEETLKAELQVSWLGGVSLVRPHVRSSNSCLIQS